jgi:hypothetical protein
MATVEVGRDVVGKIAEVFGLIEVGAHDGLSGQMNKTGT